MLSYERCIAAVEAESTRFAQAVAGVDLSRAVPSCPDWDLADLLWHLTEVQGFWAAIVAGPLATPPTDRADRPEAERLRDAYAEASDDLRTALRGADPTAACWSWDGDGGTVRWVARRQAHEAAIHRLDAELTAGDMTPLDEDVALDGVDEILTVFLTGTPGWGTFTPGTSSATLVARRAGTRWSMRLGRFTGTAPETGTTYDLPAAELIDHPRRADATIETTAARLDAWLWGGATLPADAVTGDHTVAERVRSLAADATS